MRSLTFSQEDGYPLVFLVPQIRSNEIRKEYLDAFGIPAHEALVHELFLNGKKTTVSQMKQFVTEELVPSLSLDSETKYLVVADAGYYKVLTGDAKAETNLGYVKDCLYGPWKVVYVPNYRQIFYDPEKTRKKIAQGMNALVAHVSGTYEDPGSSIIHFEEYPQTTEEIEEWLAKLLAMDCDLSIDIEAFSLKHHKAGIGTITFCWNKHEGIAFPVDYMPIVGATQAPFGKQVRNEPVRQLLKDFFRVYLRRAIYHGASYDVYDLVYQLFMTDVLDTEGLLAGLGIMLRNYEDTMLITYLATNSCAGNKLSLKDQAQEYAGNYAQSDIEDITKIPLDKLLRYNLVDGLSTWYVYEKHWDRMVDDQQFLIYESLFKPSVWDIIQMQLTGLPLNMKRVKQVKGYLEAIEQDALQRIGQTSIAKQYTHQLREKHVAKRNSELKTKRISMDDAETQKVNFNPRSPPQLQELLYEMVGLPVLDLTDSKLPATGADTLEKLINHAPNQEVKDFIQGLLDYSAVDKLLTAFIPAFEEAMEGPDGWHYLVGSFKLGGTVSGRMSSSNPNLQNLPANTEMVLQEIILQLFPELRKYCDKGKLNLGKLIKSCFEAPPGWLLCGLDFASLEDRISALTTKDPNKLKVYTDGYDGHCLRAYAYFGDQMPDIDPTSVESINSIAKLYKKLRQDGKSPTFALTYQGTWRTLVKNCGFSEELAKKIEASYHILYAVSDKWVQEKLDQAAKDGFITAAFGLRIRTPLLAQVVRGTSKTPYEAEAEGRTAGNALGQSWCLLTNRASVEFMTKVRSGPYRLDIKPCAHIHDAQYHLIRDDAEAILWANKHLVKAVQWQDHPDIMHDEVHLGGTFSIFWPTWANDIEIPNDCTEDVLYRTIQEKCA